MVLDTNYLIQEISDVSDEAELNVAVSLCEYYSKMVDFYFNNGSLDYIQEASMSNKEILAKFKDDVNKPILGVRSESFIKSILMVIPRLINAIIKSIRKVSDNKKIESTIKTVQEIQNLINYIQQTREKMDRRSFKLPDKSLDDVMKYIGDARKIIKPNKVIDDTDRNKLKTIENNILKLLEINLPTNDGKDLIILGALCGYITTHIDLQKWDSEYAFIDHHTQDLAKYSSQASDTDFKIIENMYQAVYDRYMKSYNSYSDILSKGQVVFYTIESYIKMMEMFKKEFKSIYEMLKNNADYFEKFAEDFNNDRDFQRKLNYIAMTYSYLSLITSALSGCFSTDMSNIDYRVHHVVHILKSYHITESWTIEDDNHD